MAKQTTGILIAWLGLVQAAAAAPVDLADIPLTSGTGGQIKPNVMLVFDDSGSMSWSHMPDHVNSLHDANGYKSSQCNSIYFNPAATYSPPVKADGTSYPNVPFNNAPYDGYNPGGTKVNLAASFRAYDSSTCWSPDCGNDTAQQAYYMAYTGSQPAMSYTYLLNGNVNTTTTFYKECSGAIAGMFTKTLVNASQQQNFANWYSYYRTRILMAKSAVGKAIDSLNDPSNYRMGFSTHSYTGTDTGNSEFQKIDDFCGSAPGCPQRTAFFSKLYGTTPSGGTPLRQALSKAGRIFAGKAGADPMQYSCQQNFTILTTDGMWNGDAGYQLDGTSAIGNQDAAAAKPMWDGATSTKTEVYRQYVYWTTTSGCSSGKKRVRGQEQRKTVTIPISPAGPTTESAWTNYSSEFTQVACQSSPTEPSPNPSAQVLVSSNTNSTGGTSNSLSDVAMYYYQTDLRTPGLGNCSGTPVGGTSYDVCENNVPTGGKDTASHQHMTTFTLGLGVDGALKYCETYESGGCADFDSVKDGTKVWPDPMDTEDLHRVDDLWHAAVNGRGKYFSAKTPDSMASGIQKALLGVSARTASSAAAATSNLEPVAGDNFAYVASFRTVDWFGDIAARVIDLGTGAISETDSWSAVAKLDASVTPTSDTRKIIFNSGGTLKEFTAANLVTQMAANIFQSGPTNPGGQLSHYPDLSAGEKAAATQTTVINYLRGQTQHEDEASNTLKLYRDRVHVLGDIVNAAPVFVKKPPFSYTDDNYSAYVDLRKSRQSVVYAGGNDGMLHAFNGDTGDELWAFIPTGVMPNLYKLADKNYSGHHQFFVDGPITVSDVCLSPPCDASQWRTLLVGGLGKGGRAYYALDITVPNNPQLLWEFADTNLGYSFGNPVITKKGNQWVVIVGSGYNNVSPGDGKGRLFVLKADDGSKLEEIITDPSVTDPAKSGIAKINNWVQDSLLNNSTTHVYGGDLDGNVWRFDIVAGTVMKITTVGKVAGASTQPITVKPELAEVKIGGMPSRLILLGTGRYLGMPDVSSTDLMSLYVIRDDLVTPPYGHFRAHSKVVVQDLTSGGPGRQISYNKMTDDRIGWYMDLDVKSGERSNIDSKYQLGWWVVPSNIPDPSICNIGGSSWLYFVDPWPRDTKVADPGTTVKIGNALIVGINVIKLPNGKTVTIVTTSDAKYPTVGNPTSPTINKVRRLYWRELTR